MIEVKNLYHDYEGKGNYAVYDLSFTIPDGKIFGFLGPSGSGKSTVQNLMTKLLKVQKGEICYDGSSVTEVDNEFFNSIGYSFELPNIYLKLTGYENLKYYAGLFSVPTGDPLEILDMVGLKNAASKKTAAYSKGMKQRLLFARSIINNPKILFLDEPMSGLDPTTSERIKEIIRDKQKQGTTIFLTTHNMYAAEELCDEVAFLHEGKTIAKDSPRNLKLKYGDKVIKADIRDNGHLSRELLSPEKESDTERLKQLLLAGKVETLHSQEASLEEIFIQMTGRGLA
jgi:fluoroquinolone transport system ATP-binding protein